MNRTPLKSIPQVWLSPLLQHVGIHPHLISLFAVAVMGLAGAAAVAGRLGWAGGLILLSGLFDFMDGAVARARSRESPFGALLDRVCDRVCDLTITAALILSGRADLYLGMIVLSVVPLASYVSACLEAVSGTRLGEKLSLRALRILLLAAACFSERIDLGLSLMAGIGVYSVVRRLIFAHRYFASELRHPSTDAAKWSAVDAGR